MSKIKATVISKNSSIPENKSSIPIGKESKQTPAENQNQMILTPPYDTSALALLYDMNAYHKRCCLVKAGITVRLGFSLYDPKNDKAKPDKDYTRAEDFVNTYLEELHNFQLDDEIFGNSYLEIVRNNKGEVAEVYHIPGKDTQLMIENKKRYLRTNIAGTYIDYIPYLGTSYDKDDKDRHEYIHRKNYNPVNRYYGTPDYSGAIGAIYLDDSAKTFNTNRFSDPVPETLIALAGMADDDATEKAIKDFFTNNFGDSSKAGRKALLLQFEEMVGGLKEKLHIEKLERENKDASFRGMRQDNREEIISAHGLSPRLVGLESASRLGGGGEVREQLRLINELIFIPRKKSMERIINNLFLGMKIEKWKIKFDNFEFTNAVEDAQFYTQMVIAGVIDADEARTELGYGPRKSNSKSPAVGLEDEEEIGKSDEINTMVKILKEFRHKLEQRKL